MTYLDGYGYGYSEPLPVLTSRYRVSSKKGNKHVMGVMAMHSPRLRQASL